LRCPLGLGFGAIDVRVRRRIDDHVRLQLPQRAYHHVRPVEIPTCISRALAIEHKELAEQRERPAKLPAHLAVAAEEHEPHSGDSASRYWRSIQRRYSAFRTPATQSACSRYQRTVFASPVLNRSSGCQPSSARKRESSSA